MKQVIFRPIAFIATPIIAILICWFFLVPRFAKGLHTWGIQKGLFPRGNVSSAEIIAEPQFISNISFKSNRGPFTLVIDDLYSYRSSDSEMGLQWIIVPSLPAGEHDLVATLENGQTVELNGREVSDSVSSFLFYFPPDDSLAAHEPENPLNNPESEDSKFGVLVLNTTPPGAFVKISDSSNGISPLELKILPGHYLISVLLEGHKTVFVNLEIEAGEKHFEEIILEKGSTVMAFDIIEPGKVYMDDVFITNIPSNKSINVPSGEHLIKIVYKDEQLVREFEIELIAGDFYTLKDEKR